MAKRVARLKVWFDEEGDFLEVTFANRKGSFRSIGPDIFERVDAKGKVIGFAILNFLKHDQKTVEIPLEEQSLSSVDDHREGSQGQREGQTRAAMQRGSETLGSSHSPHMRWAGTGHALCPGADQRRHQQGCEAKQH